MTKSSMPRAAPHSCSHSAAQLASFARSEVVTFGLAPGADWRGSDLRPHRDGTAFDVTHAGEVLGYAPRTPIRAGLRKFAEWMRGEGRDWT